MLGVGGGVELLDADLEHLVPAHIEILADVVILSARNETEFESVKVNSNCVRVKGVVSLAHELELGADMKVLPCLRAVPIGEACDVEVGQMDLCSLLYHNAIFLSVKLACIALRYKNRMRLSQDAGQPLEKFSNGLLFLLSLFLRLGI